MLKEYTYKRKPRKCPKCGFSPVADILYGYVQFNNEEDEEKFREEEKAGKFVLGGCCIGNNDPQWQCSRCGIELYKIS